VALFHLTFLDRKLNLARSERLLLVHMGVVVALLLAAYTVAKVLRDSLFITAFGARALPYGYLGVAAASILFVWLDPFLVRLLKRSAAAFASQLFAIAASAAAALAHPHDSRWLAGAFYLWTGSQLMMLIPHFWLLAIDQWDSRRARTIFPILTGFGLLGGVGGGAFAHFATRSLGVTGLLWSLTLLLTAMTALSVLLAGRRPMKSPAIAYTRGGSRLRIILGTPFLRYFVTGLTLSVVVGTLVDFQFKVMAQQAYPDQDSLTRFFGAFHAGLNAFAMLLQFTAAGWILRTFGLGAAAAIQPQSVLAFSLMTGFAPAWGIVLALRWAQGVIFQTIGKSVTEIYVMAVRPPDLRRIKAAIDIGTERGADALVGLMLILMLRFAKVELKFLAGFTAFLAAVWLVVQIRQHREYTRSFGDSLSGRWIDPEEAAASLQTPAGARALRDALRSSDERVVILALELCRTTRYRKAAPAIQACLEHESERVRAAAVRTMTALAIPDPTGRIPGFLTAEDEWLKRAAIEYLVANRPDAATFTRSLLEGQDPIARDAALEALEGRSDLASEAVNREWVARLVAAETAAERTAGARALGLLRGPDVEDRLRALLTDPDPDVQEAALRATARQPSPALDDAVLAHLAVPECRAAAVAAAAARGDRVVPALQAMITAAAAGDGNEDSEGAQSTAARALAAIGSEAARAALLQLVRNDDRRLRHLGLRSLNRIRLARDEPVLDRALAHRVFLRELRDYRKSLSRTRTLRGQAAPELGLLADTYAESADRALERALRALACWYEALPFRGIYRGLSSGERDAEARALEYLEEILPGKPFRVLRSFFETGPAADGTEAAAAKPAPIAECIARAWEGGDPWLKACALRAASVVPEVDWRQLIADGESKVDSAAAEHPLVRAEIERLEATGRA
jgi:AAA family ATP:ADP antiporter